MGVVPPLPHRLAPPRLTSRLIARQRLAQHLRSIPAPNVYVVDAPAGYGKSTLVAQLVASDSRRLAWLTLDEQDADPVHCISDLVFALGIDGFVAYYWVDAGDGVMVSTTVFQDQAGADASNERATAFIRDEDLGDLWPNPAHVTAGEVVAAATA